jgi:Ni/Co efflux regulator RcnB
MTKLLSALVAAVFAVASLTPVAFAADTKEEKTEKKAHKKAADKKAPKSDEKKDEKK